jgi:hypothetical protein
MIRTDLLPVANHLWQSTLCTGVVWVLTLALRKNCAAVRFWLWLAASVKKRRSWMRSLRMRCATCGAAII